MTQTDRDALTQIAAYPDEDDEWDAVEKYKQVREIAARAIKNPSFEDLLCDEPPKQIMKAPLLPCDIVIDGKTYHRGIKMSKVQEALRSLGRSSSMSSLPEHIPEYFAKEEIVEVLANVHPVLLVRQMANEILRLRSLGTPSGERHPPCVCSRDHGQQCSWPDCYFGNVTGHNKPSGEQITLAAGEQVGEIGDQPSGTVRVPVAWLIIRPHTVGKGEDRGVVLSPLTDEVHMDEGDEAWPLYLDEAAAKKDGKC